MQGLAFEVSLLQCAAFLKNTFLKSTFFILAIIIFVLAIWSFAINKYIFLLLLLLSLGIFFLAMFNDSRTKGTRKKLLKDSALMYFTLNKSSIEDICFPACVINDGFVVYANALFKNNICRGEDCKGVKIDSLFPERLVEDIKNNTFLIENIYSKKYEIFTIGQDDFSLVCFHDCLNNETRSKKTDYKFSVGMIVFDNKEEILRESSEEESSKVISQLEQRLQKWISRTSGFLKKLGDNKYLALIEEKDLKIFIDNKFEILEEIREIKLDDNKVATISAGFSKGASTFKDGEQWAKNALSMALGRGGDQVVVKSNKSYDFFGGVSKGTEKLDKVRTRVIANTLVEHIKMSDCVLIMGHKYSDLDSVGACVGMWSAISKGQKKPSYIIINKDMTLAPALVKNIDNSSEEEIFINEEMAVDLITDKTLLIIMDTHSAHFVESEEIYTRSKKTVVIDHHRMMVNHIRDAIVFFHEPVASSASEMVTELVQYMGSCTLNNFEAQALLAGIMLDTKNFVLKTGVRTFEAAAFLRKRGADTVAVKRLFSNSINTYKEKSYLVSSSEIFNNCAVVLAPKELPDMKLAAVQAADELLEIEDVRASFVIYPEGESVSISARSMGDVNVQVLMEKLGGGGHQTMAGAKIENQTLSKVREMVIDIITNAKINIGNENLKG